MPFIREDFMYLDITDENKDVAKELKIESIKLAVRRELRTHPDKVKLINHLISYINKVDVFKLMDLERQLLDDTLSTEEIATKIRELHPPVRKRKRVELFNIFHEQRMVDTIKKYCRLQLSGTAYKINDEALNKLGEYLYSLTDVEDLYEAQDDFFRCTSNEELHQLIISKISSLKL